MFNAIYLALRRWAGDDAERRRHVVVVVSDGTDTSSRITEDNLRAIAAETAATLYAVIIEAPRRSHAGVLSEIARTIGGQEFRPAQIQEVQAATQQIADAIGRGELP